MAKLLCYIYCMGRPPKPEGQTPVRTVRIGNVWDEAKAIAEERGEKLPAVIDAALRRYVARHRHKLKSGSE